MDGRVDANLVLEEDYQESYEPTDEEIAEYCKVLGLDPVAEKDLLFIAKEGIKAPLPKEWKPVLEGPESDNIYYFNFATGESTWEHPCDVFYRKLLQQEREKKAGTSSKTTLRPKVGRSTLKKKTDGSSKGSRQSVPLINTTNTGNTLLKPTSAPGLEAALQGPSTPGGRLAPLPLTGKSSLPSAIGGLPLLKKTVPSLGTVQEQGTVSTPSVPGAAVSASKRHSTLSNNLLGKIGTSNNKNLGTVHLTAGKISTQYEEEGSSKFDSEDGSASDINSAFKSKLGMTLLGVEDLGLKESEDDDSDAVNRELRKVLDIAGTSEEDSDESHSPRAPSPDLGHPAATMMMGGLLSSEKPRPQTRQGVGRPRPGHGGSRSSDRESSLGDRKRLGSETFVIETENEATKEDALKAKGREAELHSLKAEHEKTIQQIKRVQNEELEELRRRAAKETQQLEDALKAEKETKMAEFRKLLASERLSDEAELKAKKAALLTELKNQLEDQQEEEEAQLMEGKQDALRKIKQQVSQALDKEKAELNRSKETSIAKLKEQIKKEREDEEARLLAELHKEIDRLKQNTEKELQEAKETRKAKLHTDQTKTLNELKEELQKEYGKEREKMEAELRADHQRDLHQLRARLEKEKEEERKATVAAHERELEAKKQKWEREVQQKLATLEKQGKDELDALLKRMAKENQDALQRAKEEDEKKEYNLEQIKSQAEVNWKELSARLDNELEKKKSEMISHHEAELRELKSRLDSKLRDAQDKIAKEVEAERVKLEKELDAARVAHLHEHELKVEELKEQFESAAKQLEKKKAQQAKELETINLQYQGSREELLTLKQDVDQQLERVKGKRKKLTEQEAELKIEEERLKKLKTASSKEAEDILRGQEQKLKEAITKEKKALTSLKESRNEVEGEIEELNQRKVALKLTVEELGKKESQHRLSVEELDRKIKEHRKSYHKITQESPDASLRKDRWPASPMLHISVESEGESSRNSPTGPLREDGDGKPPFAEEGGDKGTKGSSGSGGRGAGGVEIGGGAGKGEPRLQESWMMRGRRSESPDAAMNILELQSPPTTFKKGLTKSTPKADDVDARLARHQRELIDTLTEEKLSLNKTKAYLNKQQRTLRERKIAWENSNKQLHEGLLKSQQGAKSATQDGHYAVMRDIQAKLDQEAAALAELEQKMKVSNRLLSLKEKAVDHLQASVDPSETIPKDHLSAGLSSFLDVDRLLNKTPQVNGGIRDRHLTGASPTTTRPFGGRDPVWAALAQRSQSLSLSKHCSSGDRFKDDGGKVESDDEISSFTTSSSNSEAEMMKVKPRSQSHLTSQSPKIEKKKRKPYKWRNRSDTKDWDMGSLNSWSRLSDQNNQVAMLDSLNTINSQLGTLLDRLNTQDSYTMSNSGSLGTPFRRTSLNSKTTSLDHSYDEYPPRQSSSVRWAEPVMSQGRTIDMPKRRQSHLGYHHTPAPTPFLDTSVLQTRRSSTEEQVRNQTDWLKEFRHSVPVLTSELRKSSVGGIASTATSPPPLTGTQTTQLQKGGLRSGSLTTTTRPRLNSHTPTTLLATRPKLILDSSDKIQLVHV